MPKLIDLTGNVYGKLTVIKRALGIKCTNALWECLCECGNTIISRGPDLKKAKTISCGCSRFGRKLIDLTGQRFGMLTVIERAPNSLKGDIRWLCKCDCDNTKVVLAYSLTGSETKSCGCSTAKFIGEKVKRHGLVDTSIYHAWGGMKSRCLNPLDEFYDNYGGRGITICTQWMKFLGFYKDMGASYYDGASIERDDVNGNYEPSNCRWINMSMQSRNRTNVPLYEFKGDKLTLGEISKLTGINWSTLYARVHKFKWPLEDAFKTRTLKPTEYHLHKFKSTV
jgi:hypothetical protein